MFSMFQKSVRRGRSFKEKDTDTDSLNIKVKQRSKSQHDPRKKSRCTQINDITKNRQNVECSQIISTEDRTLARNAGKIRNVLTNKFIQTFNKFK